MAEWMLMVLEDEIAHAAQAPSAIAELVEARARFTDELRRDGRLVDRGRFRPSREGKRIGSDRVVRDGPFLDEGNALGAYYCVEAETLDDAAKLATSVPVLASDAIDVRPLLKGNLQPEKHGNAKVFGFAVLGNAPNEEAWSSVMERIDAEGSERTAEDEFLGGVRLKPPTTGKRIERRAVFDGPFLESKEVIGGVFFMRMSSIEDAVAWARGKRFLAYGGIEIRELSD